MDVQLEAVVRWILLSLIILEIIMKKFTGVALAAALMSPFSAFATCEVTDVILSTGLNPDYESGAQLFGVLNFDTKDIDTMDIIIDGAPTGGRSYSFDDIEFWTDYINFPAGTTHSVVAQFTLDNGTVIECGETFTVPTENAPPVIIHDRMEHYDVVAETEDGVIVTVFADVIDTDENVALEDIQYELVTAPDGVEVPAVELYESFDGVILPRIVYQEIEFTVPGEYSLRVKATDAYGEVAYSNPIEFNIGGCKTASIAEHTLAGRAQNIGGSFFTTGAYVYLGYQNGGDSVALEKIEELGDWWVVCP